MVLSPPRSARPVGLDPDLGLDAGLSLDLGPADPFLDPEPTDRPLAGPAPVVGTDPPASPADPPLMTRPPRRRRVVIAVALAVAVVAGIMAVPRGWWPAAPGRLPIRHTALRPPPTRDPKSVIIQARARQRRRRRRIAMSTLPVVGAAAGWAAGGGRPPWHRHRSRSNHRGRGGGVPGQISRAEELPGLAALNKGRAGVGGLSCPSAGDCALGGSYTDSTGQSQAFVASQVAGSWARAEEVPGTAALNTGGPAEVKAVSCPSAGNCLAGGFYTAANGQQGFLVAENGGAWGRAQPVPGLPALNQGRFAEVDVVSCSSVGNCAAGGSYASSNGNAAFVIAETNGRWGTAQPVPGLAALATRGAFITAISCTSGGSCTAGGVGSSKSGNDVPFAVSETGAAWGTAQRISGTAAMNKDKHFTVSSISCASAGNCGLAGSYGKTMAGRVMQAFVASEAGGTWANAEPVPGLAALHETGGAAAMAVSCPAAGECAVGGNYADAARHWQAFIATQDGGTWQAAQEVPGSATLNVGGNAEIGQMSCASVGTCTAGGNYTDAAGNSQALIVTQAGGTWHAAREVPGLAALATRRGTATLAGLSCPSASSCGVAGGYARFGQNFQVFVTGGGNQPARP